VVAPGLSDRFREVRARTEALAAPLSPEDQTLQSMPSASPTKWHRAHTTWFFEEFVLGPRGVPAFDPSYRYLFNSYYEAVGPRHLRARRGVVSRPGAAEVGAYRAHVDDQMLRLLAEDDDPALLGIVTLGLNHEEQHQELLLTDILSAFHESPLAPAYRPAAQRPPPRASASYAPARFASFEGGVAAIGADPSASFTFDNEGPRHRVYLEPFALAHRCVTVGEVRAFVDDGGYRAPALWRAEGYDRAKAAGRTCPAYLRFDAGVALGFTVDGEVPLADDEPASHLDWYEADAIAAWLGGRLPTEAEWEHAAAAEPVTGERFDLRPAPAAGDGLTQLYGDVWQWTSSAYSPYPGFSAAVGAVGEYNGKFMVNQMVLRGGSCFTPPGHTRATYRNFWHPDTAFQVTGARVARSL
jgi:ergothioneine biosynthesis protein EgtB